MKIIKNGKDRTYQGECKRCGNKKSEVKYSEMWLKGQLNMVKIIEIIENVMKCGDVVAPVPEPLISSLVSVILIDL